MIPPPVQDVLDQVVEYVRDEGYVALHVYDPDDEDHLDFTYSVGFPVSLDQPEALVFSLPKWVGEAVIQILYSMMSQQGLRLEDGLRIGGLLEGFDCVAREIIDREAIETYFCTAIGYHRSEHGTGVDRAFQIVWPDIEHGLFPWEPGCPQAVIDAQPALYRVSLNS